MLEVPNNTESFCLKTARAASGRMHASGTAMSLHQSWFPARRTPSNMQLKFVGAKKKIPFLERDARAGDGADVYP